MRILSAIPVIVAVIVLAGEPVRAGLLTADYETQLSAWIAAKGVLFESVYEKSAGHTSADFHTAVDGRGPTVALIEVQVPGSDVWQVIGGYNPESWSSADGFRLTPDDPDRFAFIFNLNSTTRFDQKLGDPAGEYQFKNLADIGPQFGSGPDLLINGDLLSGLAYSNSYGPNGPGLTNILGLSGTTAFIVGRMETYSVRFAKPVKKPIDKDPGAKAVPEPSSVALLATGWLIGALRMSRRRSA